MRGLFSSVSNERGFLSQKTPRIGPCERESKAIDWSGLAGRIHRSVQVVRLDWLPCYRVSSSERRADLVSKLGPALSRRWSGTSLLSIDCRGLEHIRTNRQTGEQATHLLSWHCQQSVVDLRLKRDMVWPGRFVQAACRQL